MYTWDSGLSAPFPFSVSLHNVTKPSQNANKPFFECEGIIILITERFLAGDSICMCVFAGAECFRSDTLYNKCAGKNVSSHDCHICGLIACHYVVDG